MKTTQIIAVGVAALTAHVTLASIPAIAAEADVQVSSVHAITAIPSPPAPGACGAFYIMKTSGAEAQVRECRDRSGRIRVDGNVIDKDNDGQCAQVYASYNVYTGVDYSPRACPKGTRVSFSFPWRAGSDAYIYLRELDV